jgi:hypothetical protein
VAVKKWQVEHRSLIREVEREVNVCKEKEAPEALIFLKQMVLKCLSYGFWARLKLEVI